MSDAVLGQPAPTPDEPEGASGQQAVPGRLSEDAACPRCNDEAWVCESHPDEPWQHDDCGGAGMPCPDCNTEEPPRFGPDVLAVEYLTHDPRLN